MPVRERQLAAFTEDHAWTIPFDTSPRYLAGPGDARHVTHALAAAGWTSRSDPLSPEVRLTSPDDHQVTLQLDPQSPTNAWWRLRCDPYEGSGWYAEFSELIPVEILAGFTDALVAGPARHQRSVWEQLDEAGWTCTRQSDGTSRALSPDSLLSVEHRRVGDGSPLHWQVVAYQWQGEERRFWHGWLDGVTPSHALSGLVTALTNPEPVQRGMYDLTGHYGVTQERSSLTPEQVVEAHARRLKSSQAQARAARRPGRSPAPAATAVATARSR